MEKTIRLNKCQAHIKIVENSKGTIIRLQSYDTVLVDITASYGKKDICTAIYRYNSNTSAQHLKKFRNWLYDNYFEFYDYYVWLHDDLIRTKNRLGASKNGSPYLLRQYDYDLYNKLFSC